MSGGGWVFKRAFAGAAHEFLKVAALFFGGTSFGDGIGEVGHFAFLGGLLAFFDGFLSFGVELFGFGGGAAFVGEGIDDDGPLDGTAADFDGLAGEDELAGFGASAVDVDLAAFDGLLGGPAGFEEAGGPQPFVEADFGEVGVLGLGGGGHRGGSCCSFGLDCLSEWTLKRVKGFTRTSTPDLYGWKR